MLGPLQLAHVISQAVSASDCRKSVRASETWGEGRRRRFSATNAARRALFDGVRFQPPSRLPSTDQCGSIQPVEDALGRGCFRHRSLSPRMYVLLVCMLATRNPAGTASVGCVDQHNAIY